jgi:hypothetical protein
MHGCFRSFRELIQGIKVTFENTEARSEAFGTNFVGAKLMLG